MPHVNIASSLGFGTRILALSACKATRTSDRTADEVNGHESAMSSTACTNVKCESSAQTPQLQPEKVVCGRVVKMNSRSKTQLRVAALSKGLVTSTTCVWNRRTRFLCSSAASASVHAQRGFQGANVPVLGSVPMDAAWPNPSLKRSANGRAPAPGRWYAVHFHRPGAGVLPLSPA